MNPPTPPPLPDSLPAGTGGPTATYAVGEKVRHRQRPEWGIGAVTKVETITRAGVRDQRIWIRFPNGGLKTVLGSVAELDRTGGPTAAATAISDGSDGSGGPASAEARNGIPDTLVSREATQERGWLGGITKRKPSEAMSALPPAATDPFLSLERRLVFTLALYRFEGIGGALIDWAVAQTGLDDPLARFNRHELEAFFHRWSFERDATLARLMQEARRGGIALDSFLAKAPLAAQRAAQLAAQHAGQPFGQPSSPRGLRNRNTGR